jgi:hypothetical protein
VPVQSAECGFKDPEIIFEERNQAQQERDRA